MRKTFRKGDWVFADFRLMMIDKAPKSDRSISVFDGILSTSSQYVFHLSLHTNLLSMHADSWSNKLHSYQSSNINPQIFYHLKYLWSEGCKAPESERDNHYKIIDDFCLGVIDSISAAKKNKVSGINIFR